MTMPTRMQLSIFVNLVRADLRAFWGSYRSETEDMLIYIAVVTLVTGYMMPLFGVPLPFVLLSFTGIVGSAVSFRTFDNISGTVSDLCGDRAIDQRLILPVPSWMTLAATVTSFFLRTMCVCVWVLPLGLLLLWGIFPLEHLSLWRYAVMLVLAAFFFSAFSLVMASMIDAPHQLGRAWIRVLFPLWFFGGLQFTWEKLHGVVPLLAYVDLINPYVYTMEGMRTALTGPSGNLPFWACVLGLVVLSAFAFLVGVARLKGKLDYVSENTRRQCGARDFAGH